MLASQPEMLFMFVSNLISQSFSKAPNVVSEEVSLDTLVHIIDTKHQS